MRYRFQSTFVDGLGRVVSGGQVTVYKAGTTTLATIYSTETTGTAVSGSVITTDDTGFFSFWVDDDDYYKSQKFDIVLSKTGFDTRTHSSVSIYTQDYTYYADPGESDQGIASGKSIKALINEAGSDARTIVLNPGNYTVATALTIPTNITIKPQAGALLVKSGSGSITCNGKFKAGNQQVFSGFSEAGITFGNGCIESINPLWWGAAGDNSTDNVAPLQAAINCAARSGIFDIFLPKGHYLYTDTLYFYYHATNNADYPTDVLKQGRVTFRGDGAMDKAQFNGSIYVGTVLECTHATNPAISIEYSGSPWPLRNVKLQDLSVVANTTEYAIKCNGMHTWSGFTNVHVFQKNANGGGIWQNNSWVCNHELVFVYNSTGAGTSKGWVIKNMDISGGLIEVRMSTVEGFSKGFVIGDDTGVGGSILNNVVLFACQGIANGINFEVGHGGRSIQLIEAHSEAATTAGIWVRNNPQTTDISGYFYNPDATEGDIVLGDSTLSSTYRECGDVSIHDCNFVAINNYGVRRKFVGSGGKSLSVSRCSFNAETSGEGIGIDAYINRYGLKIENNFFNNLAVNSINIATPTVASAGTVDLSTYNDAVKISGSTAVKSITPPKVYRGGDRLKVIFTSTASLTDTGASTAITSLTSSGYTATATSVGHGLSTGNGVVIGGATQSEYNGYYVVTVVDADTFTYKFAGSATTPATGSPTFVYGNLKLSSTFSATANDVVGLVWDGTWWYQDSSSVN